MPAESRSFPGASLVVLAALLVVALVPRGAAVIVAPLLLAIIVVITVSPLLDRLTRAGLARGLGISLVFPLSLISVGGVALMVGQSIAEITARMDEIKQEFGQGLSAGPMTPASFWSANRTKDEGVITRYSSPEAMLISGLEPGDAKSSTIAVKVYDLTDPKEVSHTGSLNVTYSYLGLFVDTRFDVAAEFVQVALEHVHVALDRSNPPQ